MNRWIMALFASVSMLFLASGCSSKDTQTPEQQKEVIRKEAQKVLDEQKMAHTTNDFEKSLVLNQIPCYLFMFNYLIHGYSGVL